MRKLSQQESSLIERLLDRDFPGAETLRSQLSGGLVYPINDDETILRFKISPAAVRAILPYKQNVAVEAVAKDLDECRVEVLLHVKDGILHELEYVKTDGSPLQKKPSGNDLVEFIVHQ